MLDASGEEKIELQAELANKQELEKGIISAFADANPEITPDTDPSVVQQKWDEFFSQPQHLYVDTQLKKEDVESQLSQLTEGSTISFDANVDGAVQTIEAVKNEDGSITYTAEIDGVKKEIVESGTKNLDGTINYTAVMDDSDLQKRVEALKNGESITFDANVGLFETLTYSPSLITISLNTTARLLLVAVTKIFK